jgi:hypothetical protein
MHAFLIIYILTSVTLTNLKEGVKTYSVRKIGAALEISGKGDDPVWKKAHVLSDFDYPWDEDDPEPTKFRSLHNDDWLYCLFEVTDRDVNILQAKNDKWEVASSSRAEIFFKQDDKLSPYYCLEIDPLGRVLDYEGKYHRNFDLNWQWPPEQLVISTKRTKHGYTIELAISKNSLKALGLMKNNTLQAGLFRADCSHKIKDRPEFKWISWAKPESETPDFHIPSSFGILYLEEN